MSFSSSFSRALGVVICLAVVATVGAQNATSPTAPLRLVTAARQNGPVSYRDPIGVLSPDGQWLAYAAAGWVRVMHVAGGPVRTLGPRSAVVRFVTWLPDSRRIAVFANDSTGDNWWLLDANTGERRLLWIAPFASSAGDAIAADPREFRQVAWSPDGTQIAGVAPRSGGSLLYVGGADGGNRRVVASDYRLSYPAWAPDGQTVACLIMVQGRQRVSLPCGSTVTTDTLQAWGPLAFSPDGTKLYFGSPNARGTLDLWVRPVGTGAPQRLSNFARDTYAPSVSRDGRVLFGAQDYRVFVATVPSAGGATRQITTFQSETPTWSRDDRTISVTYGTWRRITDDARYPDIAQEVGLVRADANPPSSAPLSVVRASTSEDQGMDWSPNGRWIVLHSHADSLDDVWIQPANGSASAKPASRGGHETGWPRWSPDGRSIAYSAQVRQSQRWRGILMTLGVDTATGTVTREAKRVPLDQFGGDVDQVEWSANSDSLVFSAAEGLDQRAIYVVSRSGGRPRLVHRFASDQTFSGLGVSPDFRWVAFIAPAADGRFQVFRVPVEGGTPTQVTFDPSDKTQPAVSRDGATIAFTVFTYQMQFWMIEP